MLVFDDYLQAWVARGLLLDELDDVIAGSPTDQQVLTWDDYLQAWIAQDPTGGSGTSGALTTGLDIVIDGGSSAITTGLKGFFQVPFDATITATRLAADQAGDIVIDLWKDTYANFPPDVADTITASAKPTLSSAQNSEDTTLAGWTVAVTAGDWIAVNVDSASTVVRVTLSLTFSRSGPGTLASGTWQGAWDSGTAYVVGDVVENGGSSYIAIADGTNHEPPDASYWGLVASKGDTGATGATGAAGADGADGVGVPAGGTTGQVLAKASATDYDDEWVTPSGGGSDPIDDARRHHRPRFGWHRPARARSKRVRTDERRNGCRVGICWRRKRLRSRPDLLGRRLGLHPGDAGEPRSAPRQSVGLRSGVRLRAVRLDGPERAGYEQRQQRRSKHVPRGAGRGNGRAGGDLPGMPGFPAVHDDRASRRLFRL